jgi:hypothetical protein
MAPESRITFNWLGPLVPVTNVTMYAAWIPGVAVGLGVGVGVASGVGVGVSVGVASGVGVASPVGAELAPGSADGSAARTGIGANSAATMRVIWSATSTRRIASREADGPGMCVISVTGGYAMKPLSVTTRINAGASPRGDGASMFGNQAEGRRIKTRLISVRL